MDRYSNYIASEAWKSLRQRVLERDSFECQTCLSRERLEVHHKTYDRFGNEKLSDLITLCHDCHHAITGTIRRRRYTKRKITVLDFRSITPTIKLREASNAQAIEVSDYIRSTPYPAQRTNRRPTKQILKDAEANQFQERQDRRRF